MQHDIIALKKKRRIRLRKINERGEVDMYTCAATFTNIAYLLPTLFPSIVHVGSTLVGALGDEQRSIHWPHDPSKNVYIQVVTAAEEGDGCFLTVVATLRLLSFKALFHVLN